MRYLSAVPAYGRDYKTEQEVRAAWAEGKDFQIMGIGATPYVNKDDLPDGTQLNIRYKKLTEICAIIKDDKSWEGIDPETPGVIS